MDVQVWILFFYAAFNEVVNGGVANVGTDNIFSNPKY
jgi:hypothetical protein